MTDDVFEVNTFVSVRVFPNHDENTVLAGV